MRLDKTSIQDTAKNTLRETLRDVQSSKAPLAKMPPVQEAKSSIAVSRSVFSMINSAAPPVDKLSASIITFARFFSLPLKPEIMAAIRRQAFTELSGEIVKEEASKQTAESKAHLTAKYRDALSMSAAAAESKGVELKPQGLEAFAEAVDPDLRGRQNNDRQKRGKRNKNQNEQKQESSAEKPVNINAVNIEKMAIEYFKKDHLLDLLNKLPGKNGQRWIVIPLDFSQDGKEYCVSLKILLEAQESNRSSLMALDIVEVDNLEGRMSFIFEAANSQFVKLSVYFQSDSCPKKTKPLKRELSKLLDIPLNQVFVKTYDESSLCAICNERILTQVDEAV